jgi:hypothetical protein
MRIDYWCDSGANIHSCLKGSIDTSEFGLTDEDWLGLSDDEKEEYMKDVALERLNWGFREV